MAGPWESQPTTANKAMQNGLVHGARKNGAEEHGGPSSPTHNPAKNTGQT